MPMNEPSHETHPAIVNRLKRAEGHLRKIVAMIEAERSCLDIVQQLHAVEQAVANAKRTLIHDHIDHCLEQSVGPLTRQARAPIDEFKAITKYL
jgi:DNA-binding FrmR family transcriptional regulator